MPGHDPILDRLAVIHDAAVAAGSAHLHGDTPRLLDELDKATDAAVAIGELLRDPEQASGAR